MAEGRFAADALGWRAGMASWEPLASILRSEAPPLPPQQHHYARDNARSDVTLPEPFNAGDRIHERDRSTLPTPPTLHWGLVFLFTLLTLGIFSYVWQFIEASWVRKVDPKSKARLLLVLGLTFLVVGYVMQFGGRAMVPGNASAGVLVSLVGSLLTLTNTVLFFVAFFSMAASIRTVMRSYGVTLNTSGATLFFFNVFYVQGLLSWVGRWKQTGQTTPPPPRGIMWLLMIVPVFVIAILAAIAIPAYQDYIVRAQVMEGVTVTEEARAHIEDFYSQNHRFPEDNDEAALPPMERITGRYVSRVEVSQREVIVAYDTAQASVMLSGKHLVFKPSPNANGLRWECKSESTVGYKFLPVSCR